MEIKVVGLKEFQKVTGVKFTLNHNAKMENVISLSTSPLCGLCDKRACVKNSICNKCYSRRMVARYKNLREMLLNNDRILKNEILQVVPDLSGYSIVRFEAFGDIETEIQVVNYFNIAANNPGSHFALWTKNPWIIKNAIKKYNLVKPSNLQIIGSSWFINDPMTDYFRQFDFIDNVFTVYDNNDVVINCGGKSCRECGYKCYYGTHANYEINELIK